MGKKTEFVLKSVTGLLWAEILLLFSSLLNAQEGRIYTNTTSIQLVSYCNGPAKSDDLPLHCSVPVSASTITLAKLDQYGEPVMDEFLHAQVVTFCWPEEVGWAHEVASERYVLNTTVLAYTEDMTGGTSSGNIHDGSGDGRSTGWGGVEVVWKRVGPGFGDSYEIQQRIFPAKSMVPCTDHPGVVNPPEPEE